MAKCILLKTKFRNNAKNQESHHQDHKNLILPSFLISLKGKLKSM